MMVNNGVEGLKEKVSEYSESIKEWGKKTAAVATAGLMLYTSTVTGMAAGPEILGQDHKVQTYAEKHVEERDEELFEDLYHFIENGADRKAHYTEKRFEKGLEYLKEKHTEEDNGYDTEFSTRIDRLAAGLGDLFYGDKDGKAEENEVISFFEDRKDNKAVRQLVEYVGSRKMPDDEGFYQKFLMENVKGLPEEAGYRVAYLTFDDGPSENTDEILEILEDKNVEASFFVNGSYQRRDNILYREIVEEGNLLGNHGFSHDYDAIYSSEESYLENHFRLQEYIEVAAGEVSKMYRFPGGSDNSISSRETVEEVIEELENEGFRHIDWNVTSGDASGKDLSSEKLVENVIERSEGLDHAVILFHDRRCKDETVKAVPEVIEELRERGFRFETVDKAPEVSLLD